MSRDPHADLRDDAAITRLRLQVAAGARPASLADLPSDVRPVLAVADHVGAALLPTLDAASSARDQRRRIARQVDTATAPARTVAAGLALLPVVAVPVLARLLDVDLVAFYATPTGGVVGVVALALWVAGAGLIAGMVVSAGRDPRPAGPGPRVLLAGLVGWLVVAPWAGLLAAVGARVTFRARPAPPHAALADACDLVATALSGGLTVPAALREAAPHVPALRGDLRRLAWQAELGRLHTETGRSTVPPDCAPLATTLADGLAAGGPLVPALRALAREVRADRGAAAESQALRLPTRLTFPTALCLLPATVLAIGAPIVVTGLSAVNGT